MIAVRDDFANGKIGLGLLGCMPNDEHRKQFKINPNSLLSS